MLCGYADAASDAGILGLGMVDELLVEILEGRDLAGGQGDADLAKILTRDQHYSFGNSRSP